MLVGHFSSTSSPPYLSLHLKGASTMRLLEGISYNICLCLMSWLLSLAINMQWTEELDVTGAGTI